MEWKTIPGLARDLNVSDATVRRYITNFPQFFQSKKINHWNHYPVDTLTLLRRINEISAAGQRRSEVLKKLLKDFKVVRNIEKNDEHGSAINENFLEFGPNSFALIERISDALHDIAVLLSSINKSTDNHIK